MRYFVLDFYRLIAALFVMFHHFESYNGTAYKDMVLKNAHLSVDFFFVLSGFVIMHTYRDKISSPGAYSNFLVRRFARVYPLHFITLMFYVVLGALAVYGFVKVERIDRYDFGTLLQQLLLIHAWGTTPAPTFNFVSWSISAEWFVYLLFPAFLFLFNRSRWFAPIILVVSSFVLLELLAQVHIIQHRDWTEATYDFGALRAVPTFAAGCALSMWISDSDWRINSLIPGLGLFVLAMIAAFANVSVYIVLLSFIGSVALTAIAERTGAPGTNWFSKVRWLGDASYSIYLLHPVVATGLMAVVWYKLLKPAGVNFILYSAFVSVLVVLISAVVYKFFEVPARRLITRRGEALLAGYFHSQADLTMNRSAAHQSERVVLSTSIKSLKGLEDKAK